MKKLILAVAIISSLASCKKELECICEGGSIITNYKVYNLKETEKKAKVCYHHFIRIWKDDFPELILPENCRLVCFISNFLIILFVPGQV